MAMVVPESSSSDAALRAEQDLASNGDALASSRLHEKVIEAKEEQVHLARVIVGFIYTHMVDHSSRG